MLTGWKFRLVVNSTGFIEPLASYWRGLVYTVRDDWINDQMKHPE